MMRTRILTALLWAVSALLLSAAVPPELGADQPATAIPGSNKQLSDIVYNETTTLADVEAKWGRAFSFVGGGASLDSDMGYFTYHIGQQRVWLSFAPDGRRSMTRAILFTGTFSGYNPLELFNNLAITKARRCDQVRPKDKGKYGLVEYDLAEVVRAWGPPDYEYGSGITRWVWGMKDGGNATLRTDNKGWIGECLTIQQIIERQQSGQNRAPKFTDVELTPETSLKEVEAAWGQGLPYGPDNDFMLYNRSVEGNSLWLSFSNTEPRKLTRAVLFIHEVQAEPWQHSLILFDSLAQTKARRCDQVDIQKRPTAADISQIWGPPDGQMESGNLQFIYGLADGRQARVVFANGPHGSPLVKSVICVNRSR